MPPAPRFGTRRPGDSARTHVRRARSSFAAASSSPPNPERNISGIRQRREPGGLASGSQQRPRRAMSLSDAPPALHPLSPDRAAALRPLLDALDAASTAPRGSPRIRSSSRARYSDPDDAEVAGLFAASLAYGRADVFKPVVERVLAAMGPSPAALRARPSRARPTRRVFAGARPTGSTGPPTSPRSRRRSATSALRHGCLGARFAALFAETGGGPAALRARARAVRGGAPRRAARRARSSPAAARAGSPPPPGRRRPGRVEALEPLPALDGARPRRASILGLWRERPAVRARRPARHARAPRRARARPHRAAPTRAGGPPRRSPRRCAASIPRTRSATTSRSVTSA